MVEEATLEELIDHLELRSGRVLVEPPKLRERTVKGKLIIPDKAREYNREYGMECRVIKGAHDTKDDVSPGDRVIIPEYAGTPIWIDGQTPFWTVGVGDIIAKLTT